jgi:hypothetical protein
MRRATIVAATALFLAACSSSGGSGVPGTPDPGTASTVRATVNYVDTNARRIDVNLHDVNQSKTSSRGQSVYYDSHTEVLYQGQDYRPTDLERGDQIAVKGHNNNGQYLAETITVTRNATAAK